MEVTNVEETDIDLNEKVKEQEATIRELDKVIHEQELIIYKLAVKIANL